MIARRLVGAVLCLASLASACTGSEPSDRGGPAEPPVVPASPEVAAPPEKGPGSAVAALEELCTFPRPDLDAASEVPAEGPTPPTIAEVMRQLERIRGFEFSERVVAESATQQKVAEGISRYVETTYPKDFYRRRSLAWQTIGVIPEGTQIRDELVEYVSTQVVGHYDTITGKLVFIGTDAPSPLERITLAHELTHAIDDQRFGLEKVDVLGAQCRDEELEAAIALVEGNATFFMFRWAQAFLSAEEQLQVTAEAASQEPPPSDIAPFIDAIQQWPYIEGMSFIATLEGEGGLDAVDAAFRDYPVSTEQIIHPERYPNDVPTPVDVSDLAGELGRGWEDLDVQGVGEMWLDQALKLRLDDGESERATTGWDGGTYRAWSKGERVALVLATVWDSERDAAEFADAIDRWIGDEVGVVLPPEGRAVRVLFASHRGTLGALETGIG